MRYVLDTNILTAILKRENLVLEKFGKAQKKNGIFLLCPFVFYEIYRGLRHQSAKRQIISFFELTQFFIYRDFEQDDWQHASEIWASLRNKGIQIHDADLLIGVYTQRRKAILVTDNVKDFSPLNIDTENWRRG